MDEARQMNNHYISTEHLLLGLAREGRRGSRQRYWRVWVLVYLWFVRRC